MSKREISHEGELELGASSIPCYVLKDGTRVLSGRGMQNAVKIGQRSDKKEEAKSGVELSRFLKSKWFKSLITKDLTLEHFQPLVCYKGKQKINGYEATVLVDLCDLILDARKNKSPLTERQRIIADECEVLVRSFAKVGITALIDEATGYQYDREKDELQKILKAYISEELLPWQKKFPDVFYKELFRLNKWDFTVKGIKRRPGVVGRWTNTLIYDQLPKGVKDELKKNTPKNEKGNYTAKFHQSLTTDIGNPHLAAQINQITTLFQLSDNMKHMWSQFKKLKSRQQGQLVLPFDFDSEGHTVEPKKDRPIKLSKFNKNLKKALDFNPRDKE